MNSRGSAISLAVLLLSAVLMLSLLSAGTVSGSSSDPVSISGDADLVSQAASKGWPGDGTPSNPYLISGVSVDNPANGLGIFVSGTTKHLVIEDCTISNTTSYGIDITGASNVTVRGSTVAGCFCGILIYSSTGCTVADNSLSACQTGVQLMSSDHILVSGNAIVDSQYNGIELLNAENNTVTGNTVTGSGLYGLALYTSSGNTIYGNAFTANNGAGTEYRIEHAQAYDLGTNSWSHGGTGNTWSDWSSDEPYPYEGSAAADGIESSLPIGDMLPIIAVAAVVVVAVVAIVLIVKRKGTKVQKVPAQQPPAQSYTPAPSAANQVLAPVPRPTPKIKPWVPAVAAVAVIVVVMLVAASTMGWLPIGSGKLSGARDIGGEWEGTGTFWNYNIYGEKGMLIQASFHMKLTLNGNHVTGTLDIYPTSQTKITDDIAVQEPENHLWIDGTYEVTTLTFETYNTVFEFEFLTDMATGQMTNTDDYAYLGLGSDHGAIHLQRP